MDARRMLLLTTATVATVASTLCAQTRIGGGREDQWTGGSSLIQMEGGAILDENTVRTAREIASHSTGTPEWTNPPAFEKDVFTFARVMFKSGLEPSETLSSITRGIMGRGPNLTWWVDFPDADLNFSYRLQQTTSIRTNPDGRVVRLTDPDLTNFPLLFMEHPGYIKLRDEEVTALSKYLRNGGVLLVVDFWSQRDWDGFAKQMKIVLPERSWTDLDIDHPIFNCVYNLQGPMKRLQVPTIQFWNRAYNPEIPGSPLQMVDRGPGSDARPRLAR
jgi:hypothetical protein